jgi:divalent metal cation (Fe/Co/Zn/Cd) transporter
MVSFIIFAGYGIIKEGSRSVLDVSGIEEKEICDLIMGGEGVKGCHKIRTCGAWEISRSIYACLVQSDISLGDVHLVSYKQ